MKTRVDKLSFIVYFQPAVYKHMIEHIIVEMYSKKKEIPIESSFELHQKLENFLEQAVEKGVPVSPSIEVDEVWHNLILNTRYYQEYCLNKFGKFIHHTPGNGDCKIDCTSNCTQNDCTFN